MLFELENRGRPAREQATVLAGSILLLAVPMLLFVLSGNGDIYNMLHVALLVAVSSGLYLWILGSHTVRIEVNEKSIIITPRQETPIQVEWRFVRGFWQHSGGWTLFVRNPKGTLIPFKIVTLSEKPVPMSELEAFRRRMLQLLRRSHA
jgi:hypothetical protein